MSNYNERLDDVLSAVYLAGTENGLGRSHNFVADSLIEERIAELKAQQEKL